MFVLALLLELLIPRDLRSKIAQQVIASQGILPGNSILP